MNDIKDQIEKMTNAQVVKALAKRGITIERTPPLNIHWHRRYKLMRIMEQEEELSSKRTIKKKRDDIYADEADVE